MTYSLYEAYLSIYSEEFKDLTPDKYERVKARHAELFSDIMKNYDEVNRLRKKPFSRHRPGIKQKIRELVGKTKKNAILAQNAGDALIRSDVSREAKIKYMKNKLLELEPKNKIVKFQREEIELILNYLLDEGYADSFDSANAILNSMSDEWYYEILHESSLSDMFGKINAQHEEELHRDKDSLQRIQNLIRLLSDHAPDAPDEPKRKSTNRPSRTRQEIIADIKQKISDAETTMARQDKENH